MQAVQLFIAETEFRGRRIFAGKGLTRDEAIANSKYGTFGRPIVEVREVTAQKFEDGDRITATILHTQANEDGIDHVIGQSEVSGIVTVEHITAQSGRVIKIVSLNNPFGPNPRGVYVALDEYAINGASNVLRDIRFLESR